MLALVEIWTLVAEHSGFVGAWRLMGVCKASWAGAKEWLGTLPGLMVCGEFDGSVQWPESEVWRLDLATLLWMPMPTLLGANCIHACCTVRGALVVIGGSSDADDEETTTSNVEILSKVGGNWAFTSLPSLSCGRIQSTVAITVDESISVAGQVLVLGGIDEEGDRLSTVQLVDLATGVCTPQAPLLCPRHGLTAVRIPDGRVVCTGGIIAEASVEVWGPPDTVTPNAPWTWTELSAMHVGRGGCVGCVMSDGRLAVLGGRNWGGMPASLIDMSTCEVLTVGEDEHWSFLPPMRHARSEFACAAVAKCIIVAGGGGTASTEVYDEVLNLWIRLPCDLPCEWFFLDVRCSAIL
jgi:hypothetical protein